MLQTRIFPAARASHPDGFIFQHDNATPHSARVTRELFDREGIELLSWPAMSPDLNPVENLWAIIARRLYTRGIVYDNEDGLWEAIHRESMEIEREILEHLVDTMPERFSRMIHRHGRYAQ